MSTGAENISKNMCSGTKLKTQAAEKRASKLRAHWTTTLRAVYIHNTINQQTLSYTSCRAFRFWTLLQKLAVHSMYFDNIADALVNGLHSDIPPQHHIHCTSENTDTYHFRGHGSTHSRRYGNFADRDPLVPVHSFHHNTTTCLGAAVTKASHRLRVFCLVPFINNVFLYPSAPKNAQWSASLLCSRKMCFTSSSI